MDAYLLCATPRTGTSLLCGLLDSTGVAGHPESYFRAPDAQAWAKQWGIVGPDGTFDYADYLRGALAAGRTDNGVFAARVMWGTLAEVVANVKGVYRELFEHDLAVLQRAFGSTRFVYVRRDDTVAQAVSWLRAEQTDVWFETTESHPEPRAGKPRFDLDRIGALHHEITAHNAAWQRWFDSVGVEPFEVRYEDLNRDPVVTTRQVLDYLDLELPPGRGVEVRHRRLADELNEDWIERFRASTIH